MRTLRVACIVLLIPGLREGKLKAGPLSLAKGKAKCEP